MNQSTLLENIWQDLLTIRSRRPLILNLTNQVAMALNANGLLALGASPLMSRSMEEMEELVELAEGLVLNIGTLDLAQLQLMHQAGDLANARSLPIVLDPVGAGASKFRTTACLDLLNQLQLSAIRGNASEILSLAGQSGQTKGVDSAKEASDAAAAAASLAGELGCLVCISGSTDILADGRKELHIANGHPMMSSITGLGCTATALIGAFAAVSSDIFTAAAGAMTVLGISGQLAAKGCSGPGSLQTAILDRLHTLSQDSLLELARLD
jgi:hydroxyethylthiazole kinase